MIPPAKILIIQLRRIGDTVLLAPALDAAREAWPTAKIHLLTEYPACDLFEGDDRVDAVWLRPPRRSLPRLALDLRREGFDLALDFQSLPVTAILARATGAYTVGFEKRFRRYHRPVRLRDHRGTGYTADHKLDLLRALGVSPTRIQPTLAVPAVPTGEWDSFPDRPRVVLSPVSPWPHKRWSDEAFIAAATRVHRETGAAFVVAGGPGEEDQIRAVAAGLEGIPHRACILSKLRDLAGLLRESDVFLGNDNGPRHIAIALGIPSLGYFSEVDPVPWTPPDPRHPVLWDLAPTGGGSVPSDRIILPPAPETAARLVVDLLHRTRDRSRPTAAQAPSREGTP